MQHDINTVDGEKTVESVKDCDGCGATIRVSEDEIAYEHGDVFGRHSCPEMQEKNF